MYPTLFCFPWFGTWKAGVFGIEGIFLWKTVEPNNLFCFIHLKILQIRQKIFQSKPYTGLDLIQLYLGLQT